MLTEIKKYKSDTVPNKNTLEEALNIAQLNGFILRIEWFVPYSGTYHIDVSKDDTIEKLQEKLPKIYGL